MFFANFFSKLNVFFSSSTNKLDGKEKKQGQKDDIFFSEETLIRDTKPLKPTKSTITKKNIESDNTLPARSIHQVNSITELSRAIQHAAPRDTIIITRAGRYGKIRLTNKSQLTIKALNTDMPIEASFFIDGKSQQITIENIQLWHNIANASQIIITAKTTHSIIVQHCILSTTAVNRSSMLNAYSGHPRSWNNGIRMLGNNGQIINNTLINLNLAISETGPNTLVTHNHIQFYTENAIRISHHGVKVENNTIYDSVIKRAGQNTHKDAIQLIPPENRFNAGTLNNITITGNIIQSNSAAVPSNEHGTVQGILGRDGHFVNTVISDNIIAVNSDHGITLNGVKNARISNNRILDQTPTDNVQPGIKLYLTRISQGGKQSWLANLSYSVHLDSNQAPALNIPKEAYTVKDASNNRIETFSHHLARGNSPTIIRNTRAVVTKSVRPIKKKSVAETPPSLQKSKEKAKATTQTTNKNTIHTILNKEDLNRALSLANEGDTLLIQKAGHYGTIRFRDKKRLCLKATDKQLIINAHLLISGTSSSITVEGINLWYSEDSWKPVILSSPSTNNITIKNCLVSSTSVPPESAKKSLSGEVSQWTTGIWLRGSNNQIENNHIVNVSTGITASGRQTRIKNNLIQFYTDSGIRVFNHDIQVQHNRIYDAINNQQGKQYSSAAIQLTPPEGRFEAGQLKNTKISNNTIQFHSADAKVETHLQGYVQGYVQGITGKEGYMIDMIINDNTIMTNTEHGIVLHGVSNLTLEGNKIVDYDLDDQIMPGIRLYYTRTIDLKGTRQQTWHRNHPYSISYSGNQAPVFNIPDKGYESTNGGNNHFGIQTENEGRGTHPMIID